MKTRGWVIVTNPVPRRRAIVRYDDALSARGLDEILLFNR
jgi:hypothetical protein